MPPTGIHSATVPGAVAGWDALLSRFGKKTFADVLAPDHRVCQSRFSGHRDFRRRLGGHRRLCRAAIAEAARVYLPEWPRPRSRARFSAIPIWRSALDEIAKGGRDAFYKGAIAKRILDTSTKLGGTMAADDLAEFAPEWVDPVSTDYRGWTVYEMPPNEQGIAALMMLNIMSGFPLGQWGHNSVDDAARHGRGKKLAYADMIAYVGDPRFAEVPTKGLISAEYGRSRAALIDPAKANCNVGPGTPPYAGSDTTYLATVDRDGNMVSLIQSNFSLWGSGDRGRGRRLRAAEPRRAVHARRQAAQTCSAARKRPLHTIIPAFMTKGDVQHRLRHHGRLQPGAGACAVRVEYRRPRHEHPGRDGGSAVQQGELCRMRCLHRSRACRRRCSKASAKLGHDVQALGDFSDAMGGGQAVMRDV